MEDERPRVSRGVDRDRMSSHVFARAAKQSIPSLCGAMDRFCLRSPSFGGQPRRGLQSKRRRVVASLLAMTRRAAL